MAGGGGGSATEQHPIPEDVDHRYAYMAGIITITVISVLIVWLRMYTRLYISRNAWWDDWIMFASTVSSKSQQSKSRKETHQILRIAREIFAKKKKHEIRNS